MLYLQTVCILVFCANKKRHQLILQVSAALCFLLLLLFLSCRIGGQIEIRYRCRRCTFEKSCISSVLHTAEIKKTHPHFLHFLQYKLQHMAEFLCTVMYAKDSLIFGAFYHKTVAVLYLGIFDNLRIFQYLFGVFYSLLSEFEKFQRKAISSPPCL